MAPRQVVDGRDGLLNLRAAMIYWGEEAGEGGLRHAATVTHLRWMMPAHAGLPMYPFKVWRRPDPGGNPDKRQLANLPDWEPLERVGLPVFDGWPGQQYQGWKQGLEGAPKRADEAAWRRLQVGAPRRGWAPHDWNGAMLPGWKEPDLARYLASVCQGKLMAGLGAMLAAQVPVHQHLTYAVPETQEKPIVPSLLLDGRGWATREGEEAKSAWHPMELLSIAAASDPLAALALGYGTAYESGESNLLYMVSVLHSPYPGLPPVEFADIARVSILKPRGLPKPATVLTRRAGYTRPQQIDGPAMESVGIMWDRPLTPEPVPLAREEPLAIAYAVGCFDPASGTPALMLSERADGVGGYLSYVPARGVGSDTRCQFTDHVERTDAALTGFSMHYAVAAQDLYGRWSPWTDASYTGAPEQPQQPHVLSVTLTAEHKLTVDFSWDWSDRSPEFIEITGSFGDGGPSTGAKFTFEEDIGGNDPEMIPLKQDRTPAAAWGEAQDRDSNLPGVRLYRWSKERIDFDLQRGGCRDYSVRARGQCRLHHEVNANWNISNWSEPVTTWVWDKRPPEPPQPETPRWASLPDAAGVSRFDLKWRAQPTAERGYFVYEATETSVREALGIGDADLTVPPTTRLNDLLNSPAADFAAKAEALRRTFRRVTAEALPPDRLSYEFALPRGSKVLHFLTVTAIGGNGIESGWPTHKDAYRAVGARQFITAPPPTIELTVPPGGTDIAIRIGLRSIGGLVELSRLRSDTPPKGVDAMGPPIASRLVTGDVADFTDRPPPGWQKLWYCATVRSLADETMGIVSSRSPGSGLASMLLPPIHGPAIADLRVNELRSTATESLGSWKIDAPLMATPLGSHFAIVEMRDTAGGAVSHRIEQPLEAIPVVEAVTDLVVPAGPDASRLIAMREGTGCRLFVWLPRAAGAALHVTVKMIDPLGRMTISATDVPPVVFTEISWQKAVEDLRGRNGERFRFGFGVMPAGPPHKIWGSDVYTDDSPVAVAAVHGGLATAAGGRVTIEILPGRESYTGAAQNGIVSWHWAAWHGSYRFVR